MHYFLTVGNCIKHVPSAIMHLEFLPVYRLCMLYKPFMDHGVVSRTIDSNISEAKGIYIALEKLGINWNEVGAQLEAEGMSPSRRVSIVCWLV
ncbi:Transaldolase [Musa troglodytarum]|uniref:Transaldolase n=1 Tax=Musa troglodytarum TaxID=320322 RepID=A0A9E7GC35_9LILI|nr:Transaldolase [Musa troglodytarum]